MLFLKQFLALNINPNLNILKNVYGLDITVTDGRNLLIGNHCFAPDIKVSVII
jgi:hypothetical protein